MTRYDPDRHHRRSIRLQGYDYSQPGAYFVTIVTHERLCWFEKRPLRDIAESEWQGLTQRFPTIDLDEFVVMPNHVHFIVWLCPPDSPAGARFNRAPTVSESFTVNPQRPTLGWVVRTFKAVITRRVRQIEAGFAWQRNYYERVIRNDRELNAVRRYIRDNPLCWPEDSENPNQKERD